MEKDIFIFGDSGVHGFWDGNGGWANRLKQYFDSLMVSHPTFPGQEFYYMVYPLGITDDTTRHILERFEFEATKRMVWKGVEQVFVFSIGKNDTAWLDLPESERNLREIIKRARRFSGKVVFLEVIPVDERFTRPVAWDKECHYENSKIEDYNTMLNRVAEEKGVQVIPVFDEWQKIDYQSMLADGVHPNNEGHRYLYEKIRDFLLKNYFEKQ